MARNALLAVLAWLVVAFVPTFLFSDYHLFQLTMVIVYAIAILGLAILTGFNGQISLGPRRVLCHRRLRHRGPDVPVQRALLGDAAGLGDRLRRVRLPDRPAGAAAGRPVSRADHLRARRRGAAAAEAQRAGAMDRRRAGAGHRQAGSAVRPRSVAGPVALSVLAVRRRGAVPAGVEHRARADRPRDDGDPRPLRWRPRRWASTSRC